jgi:hypothetical protein
MTERKAFKRRVRARMEKTGERYTSARRHVAAGVRELEQAGPARSAQSEQKERISDETVLQRTGKRRAEWFVLLDKWGASERSHTEIASHLREAHGVAGWWSQSVSGDYERARGLRAKHQRPDGWSVGASRTIEVPVERLFAAFADEAERAKFLPGVPLRLRTAQPNRSARFDWEDGRTRVIVGFTDKGERSTVFIEHERLADEKEAARVKAAWRTRLADLKDALEA